jgi:hypothetical protein
MSERAMVVAASEYHQRVILYDSAGAVLATVPVSGPLTDAQLRASAVPISATSLPLPSGAATDRTTAGSPFSIRLTDGTTFYKSTTPSDTQPVSGPLTDSQLRASAVPTSLASLPALASGTNRIGAVYPVGGQVVDENGVVRTVNRSFVNATLMGDTQVVAAQGSGIKIRVLSVVHVATLAVSIKFRSNTTDISPALPFGINGGATIPESAHGWFQTAANEVLNVNLSLTTTVGIMVLWVQAA